MKRKNILIYTVLLLVVFKLIATIFINERFLDKYRNGDYNPKNAKGLLILNIQQPYIAHYNYGNTLYQTNDFDGAIEAYQKALTFFPPKKRECAIRINLALAMLQKIKKDDNSEENKERTIEILHKAKEVLCEKDCAHREDNNGHSPEAEQLKADIERMEKELQEEQKQPKEEKKTEEQKKQEEKFDKVEQQLKEEQKEANKERQEELTKDELSSEYKYYPGKKW